VIQFSNCKINIGLHITGKRADGYHNLETVFFPVPLYDVLEIIDACDTSVSVLGQPIPGDPQNNIVTKAWKLLKADFPQLPPVHFHLLKNIPAGAGLGAGSANGAYALLSLNQKYDLGLSKEQVLHYALQLGSDCPFFIIGQPVFASGRGEVFEPVSIDLSHFKLVIINPGVHISTPWAFSQLQIESPAINLKEAVTQPVPAWKQLIQNDFEAPIFKAYPEIENIKHSLYQAGAIFALMSGSGSTVYGLFEKTNGQLPAFPQHYFIKEISI